MIDHVIKLLLPTYPAGAAEYEAEIAYKVQETGPPVPAVKAVIEHAGRFGILYERIDGVSLLRMITANPWLLARAARLLARLHVAIHACHVADLPSQRDRLARRIVSAPLLGEATRQRLLAQLEAMPDGQRSRRFPP